MSPIPQAELAAALAKLGVPTVQDQALAALAGLKPEPVCRVCHEALPLRDVDLGTHPHCDPPVVAGPQPPPTLDALSAALLAYDRNSARSRQVAVGPSELGHGCDRKLAYSLRGVPAQPDDRVKYAAMLGTGFHAVIADALRAANDAAGRVRYLVEQRVWPSAEVSGSVDCYDIDTATVIDWKVVGKSTVDKARRLGPSDQYVTQAHLYGRGLQRLNHDPRWIRIVMLPRWSHTIVDTFEFTTAYSRRVADEALDRVARISTQLDTLAIDDHPERWAEVPAMPTADNCHFCSYYTPNKPAINFAYCAGHQSRQAKAVDDYLSTLPSMGTLP